MKKTILTTAIAGLMLLGVAAGMVNANDHQKKAPVVFSDGGPMPCYPGSPGCKPLIPSAR